MEVLQYVLLCVVSLIVISPTDATFMSTINVDVVCNGTSVLRSFEDSFSLQLTLDGQPIVHSEKGKVEKVKGTDLTKCVDQFSAIFEDERVELTASLDIDVNKNYTLKCSMYGLFKDGKTYGNVSFQPHLSYFDGLSFHLFISSMTLVYLPFIVMPSVWCGCPPFLQYWRNPEDTVFKFLRGLISLVDGFLFLIWWGVVYSKYGDTRDVSAFLTFASIEGCFIFLYALFRCLFKFLEMPSSCVGPERAQNGRVAISFGAVITPVICWLIIKSSHALPSRGLEIGFLTMAGTSLVCFMYVSHLREGRYWDKKRS